MKVAVWDTYVQKDNGEIMHFDILVESDTQNKNQIITLGKEYVSGKSFGTKSLTSNECKFCHIEHAPENVKLEILEKGYSIIEMENCD
jgi:hypothetical protein